MNCKICNFNFKYNVCPCLYTNKSKLCTHLSRKYQFALPFFVKNELKNIEKKSLIFTGDNCDLIAYAYVLYLNKHNHLKFDTIVYQNLNLPSNAIDVIEKFSYSNRDLIIFNVDYTYIDLLKMRNLYNYRTICVSKNEIKIQNYINLDINCSAKFISNQYKLIDDEVKLFKSYIIKNDKKQHLLYQQKLDELKTEPRIDINYVKNNQFFFCEHPYLLSDYMRTAKQLNYKKV
jgi:hypothetical protein